MRWLVLAVVVLAQAGCLELYPSFEVGVHNLSEEPADVTIWVERPDGQVREYAATVAPGDHLDLADAGSKEGRYSIRAEVNGQAIDPAGEVFTHDGGPGGFDIVIGGNGTAQIAFWHQ